MEHRLPIISTAVAMLFAASCLSSTLVSPAWASPGGSAGSAAEALAESMVERLASLAYDNRHRIDAFAKMSKVADEAGLELYLIGGVATGYLNRLRKLDLGRAAEAALTLEQITNPLSIDVDVAIHSAQKPLTRDDKDDFRLKLARVLPQLSFDVQILEGTEHVPGYTSEAYLSTHHDSTDFLAVHLNAKSARGVVRDARDWEGRSGSRGALFDLVAGKLRFFAAQPPTLEHDRRSTKRGRPRGEMRATLRMITKSLRYGLTLDEAARRFANETIGRFDPQRVDKHTRAFLQTNGKKLFDPNNVDGDTLGYLRTFPGLVEKLHATGLKGVTKRLDGALLREKTTQSPHSEPQVALPNAREMIDTVLDIDALTNIRRFAREMHTPRLQAYYAQRLADVPLSAADLAHYHAIANARLLEMTEQTATLTLKAVFAERRLYGQFPTLVKTAPAFPRA